MAFVEEDAEKRCSAEALPVVGANVVVEIGLCAVLEVEDGRVAEQGGAFAFGVAGAGGKVGSDRFDLT